MPSGGQGGQGGGQEGRQQMSSTLSQQAGMEIAQCRDMRARRRTALLRAMLLVFEN